MKLKVAIIDDEIHAIETLSYDLLENHREQAEIVFSTTDPVDGAQKVRTEKPDLLFLDINMPAISGLDVMKLLSDTDLCVALTTAHQEYAIQAVGSNAIAYLLKPIQPDGLKEAIDKALEKKHCPADSGLKKDKIAIHNHDSIHLVDHDDIVYCKSDGNYTELHLCSKTRVVASKSLKTIEESLPRASFKRVHKSFLVNIGHISKYIRRGHGELLMTNDHILPVSRSHHHEILKLIQSYL
ncbi:MAG: LytTR family DNA-binding domain-containing protein [Bacteroidales bacterium]|nr:LytTR family DNA-binding domain-containing protein [Bacteroidales bacterium]